MTVLQTQLNPRSAEFAANAQAMQAVVDDLRAHLERVAQGGGEAARAKHTARGKLLPRDRVMNLLDPGTPFLEVAPLAALNMYNNDAPCAGVIAGIGRVNGVDCMIVCNDATVKGGTYYPMTVKKHLRAQEVALHNNLPCVYLVDSGGAFLPLQAEVFPDRSETPVMDDHTPFQRSGVPAVDFIDWDYPDANTVRDTYDKLSARAMDATGETAALLALREAAR